ncbi:MAG: ParB/RepB/Spo0J family partition protein [Roseiflexaceae bacterium]|nr:ParB/RepB/Spo0J family partition protein [Roseiflexaceae bacterium]
MPQRKNFMSDKRSGDREAQRQAVGALFDSAGNLATPQLAERRVSAQNIPLARISPNPFQARREFAGLEELADAIRAQGFISRLRVRPAPGAPGSFELVYGERRLRAAGLAGLAAVPCDIAEHSDEEMIEIGLAENIQRRDLDPLEEAQAFRSFIDQRGYSIRGLAERIGKAKGYIENRLALLRIPADVQQLVAQRPDTIDAAQQIAKLATLEERQPLIAAVASGALSAQQVRAAVRERTGEGREAALAGSGDPAVRQRRAASGATLDRQIAKEVEQIQLVITRWQELASEDVRAAVTIRAAERQLLTTLSTLVDESERTSS